MSLQPKNQSRPTLKSTLTVPFILLLLLMLLSLPLVAGFFGRYHPALDSFAHFRAHLAILMMCGGIVLLFTTLKREAAMILLLGCSAFATTTVWWPLGGVNPSTAQSSVSYSLLQINLQQDNPQPKELLRVIAQNKPDIITYQEGSQLWQPWLKTLEATYPYHLQCGNLPRIWGVGIMSRRPFATTGHTVCTGQGILASALINLGGTNILVSSLHQSWPWPYPQARQFMKILPALEPMHDAHGTPVIIAGDMNATPWSNAVRRIEQSTGTQHLRGIGPTWLTPALPDWLKGLIGLPIDQILINSSISLKTISALPPAGSDHLPVIMKFSVPLPVSPDEAPQSEDNIISL